MHKTDDHQEIDLLVLSRNSGFGAVKNSNPVLSQKAIDANWHDIETGMYETVIGPFSSTRGLGSFNDLNRYEGIQNVDTWGSLAVVGALEYLWDIRPLVRQLRMHLIAGKKVDVFIGYKGGYYIWSVATARVFFAAMGVTVRAVKMVNEGIAKLTLSCSQSTYNTFLNDINFPDAKFGHLIATTEHSSYRVTGGIGSYVKECNNLYGDAAAILIIDNNKTLDLEKIKQNKWIAPQQLLGPDRVAEIMAANFDTIGDLVQETLECLTALYPQIESIEAQEMLLNRTIDAKRMGMIPQEIRLITTCHGSSFHLAKAKRTVLDAENIHVAYREKYTLEHSDTVVLPTEFLRHSYIESGVGGLYGVSRVKKRLPFDVSRLPRGEKVRSYRRLLYIGKTSTIKGFDLFLRTLLELYKEHPEITSQIEEVVVMATSTDIAEPYLRVMFADVEKVYNIKVISLDREVLLRTLAEYSSETLALVTYRGDNHPLAVLELMAIGHDFIAASAAGTPELILPGFEKHNLAAPDEVSFARAVHTALQSPLKRGVEVAKLRNEYLAQQEEINESYSIEAIRQLPRMDIEEKKASNAEKVRVYIVGDEQSADYKRTLDAVKGQTYQHLSFGRLTNHDGSLIMRLYAGDILVPDAIETMVRMYNLRDSIGAVLADETVMSFEGDGSKKGFEEFHPYAPQLGSAFLQEKYSRRIVALLEYTDLSDTYTDWQKCINIACLGKEVAVVPRKLMRLADAANYFINSPLELSSKFAHSFTALPVFDAGVLYSELHRFDQIYWGLNPLNHLNDYFVRREEVTLRAEVSPKIVRIVGAYHRFTPSLVRKAASILAEGVFRSMSETKRLFMRPPSSKNDA